MVRNSSNHKLMIFVGLVLLAVGGFYLYKHHEKASKNEKRIDTALSVPDVRGGSLETANSLAMDGSPQMV